MIISLNWLKKFIDISVSTEELAQLIGSRLVEIEEVIDLSEKYKHAITAKVVTCKSLPDSDHLSLVMIDDGGRVEDIERDEHGYVQVVCGAPNVREGMTVGWLPPGAIVPSTFNDDEPFVLGARKLRGYTSNGMLASATELDLYEDHRGIIEFDDSIKVGQKMTEALELDDTLLDIENKSLTHRPDTFGLIGFAREVAAIQGNEFRTPDWLKETTPVFNSSSDITISASIDNKELSSRYQAVVLSGVDQHAKTPSIMQSYLARSGVRPISPVVDITNYLMLLTGQPLHAFDYDKLAALNDGRVELHVRAGRGEGDTLALLDGRIITLTDADIVIANGDRAVALAGAMGGSETEIDENTKNIVLEGASFNLYNLRATQMRHGIFSEAITRFTKGQSPVQTAPVLSEAVQILRDIVGAQQVSDVVDVQDASDRRQSIRIEIGTINALLGTEFTTEDVVRTLQNVEMKTEANGEIVIVEPPYWRSDIHIVEDVVEEIGRLKGFDHIKPSLPARPYEAIRSSARDISRSEIRRTLSQFGANEVLTYSFVHGDLMKKAGQDPECAYKVVNSISPDLQYYRISLMPSLLDKIHANIRAGYNQFALFELNKVHFKGEMDEQEPKVPNEDAHVGFIINCDEKTQPQGSPYYAAKRYLEKIVDLDKLEIQPLSEFDLLTDKWGAQLVAPYEPKRTAVIVKDNQIWGVVGEYRHVVKRAFKLSNFSAGFEIHHDLIAPKTYTYVPLSKYPGAERDVCFKIARTTSYRELKRSVENVALPAGVGYSIKPVDIFTRPEEDTKNVTLRFTFTSYDKTLTGDEIGEYLDTLSQKATQETQAVVV